MCNAYLSYSLGYWKKRSLNALYYVEEFVYLSIFLFRRYSPVVLTSLFEKPVITFTHTRTEDARKKRKHTYHADWTSRETEPRQLDTPIKYTRKNSARWFMQNFSSFIRILYGLAPLLI